MGLCVLQFARIGQSPESSFRLLLAVGGGGGGGARGGVCVHGDAETGVQSYVVWRRLASGIGAKKGDQEELVWQLRHHLPRPPSPLLETNPYDWVDHSTGFGEPQPLSKVGSKVLGGFSHLGTSIYVRFTLGDGGEDESSRREDRKGDNSIEVAGGTGSQEFDLAETRLL